MASFSVTLEIARPPEDVFAYLTDVDRLPDWQTTAVSCETDGPVQLGSRIRERRTFIGRDVRTEVEVTAYDPPRRFDVRARGGPVPFAISHVLQPAPGGTQLDVEVHVKIGGMMRLAATGPLKIAEREFRSDFARLKELLEGEPESARNRAATIPQNPGA
jgi:carbon monoxide dehydrogenase subunit G